jgi:hypothetical protein
MTFANIFLLLLIFVPLIMLWVFSLTDLSHRRDLSGAAKGLWAVAIVLLPLIGMLIYFITRPNDAVATEDWNVVVGTVPPVTSSDDRIAGLERLAKLKEDGAITDEEYERLKTQVLS